MEVIVSSPIQKCSGMENDRGDVSGSMCKNKERKKIKRLGREVTENPESKLEGVRQNVDMIFQPSIQDNPNTELGTTATVELRRRKRRTKRELLSEGTENPERELEVSCQNVDVITQLEMASGTIATPDAEMVSKGEEHMEVANGLMGSDMPKNVDVEGTIQKKKKKKSRKEKPILGELLNSRQSDDMEVAIGEAGSGAIATPDRMQRWCQKEKSTWKRGRPKPKKDKPTIRCASLLHQTQTSSSSRHQLRKNVNKQSKKAFLLCSSTSTLRFALFRFSLIDDLQTLGSSIYFSKAAETSCADVP